MSRTDVVQLLYIVAFSLFIYGLMGLTGPRTAVRGNRIAAVGMAIAVDRDPAHPRDGQLGPDHRSASRSGRRSASPRRAR